MSVCIPTHDGRAVELAAAIDSVLDQLGSGQTGRVELCVSDNASRDGSERLVRERQAAVPGTVVYRRNDRDLGASRNLMAAVEMARGRWVWLLGSDDALEEGSISAVLDLLARHPGVSGASVSRRLYTRDFDAPFGLPEARLLPPHSRVTEFEGSETIKWLALYGMYMSGQILSRIAWQAARARVDAATLEASMYPHTWLLASIWSHGGKWLWDPTAHVRCRVGNDSFGGGDGLDYAAYFEQTVRDVKHMWQVVRGGHAARAARLGLLDLFLPANNRDNALRSLVDDGSSSQQMRRRLLATCLRAYWWNAGFWRYTLPALIIAAFDDTFMSRSPNASERRVRAAHTSTTIEHVQPVLRAGATWLVTCRVRNLGPAKLRSSPSYPLNLAARWFDRRTGDFVQESERTPLCPPVAPGECRQVSLRLLVPPQAGEYLLRIAPMIERLAWLDDLSAANGVSLTVRVGPDGSWA